MQFYFYNYILPGFLLLCLAFIGIYSLYRVISGWREDEKDIAYLKEIGELE